MYELKDQSDKLNASLGKMNKPVWSQQMSRMTPHDHIDDGIRVSRIHAYPSWEEETWS